MPRQPNADGFTRWVLRFDCEYLPPFITHVGSNVCQSLLDLRNKNAPLSGREKCGRIAEIQGVESIGPDARAEAHAESEP